MEVMGTRKVLAGSPLARPSTHGPGEGLPERNRQVLRWRESGECRDVILLMRTCIFLDSDNVRGSQ